MSEAFVVVDLETTHREPKDAHVVEWAAIVITPPWFGQGGERRTLTSLVKPPIAIPVETSAVHHITDADVAEAKPWAIAAMPLLDELTAPGVIAVAHNANFEREMLDKLMDPALPRPRWLCTYKAAVRVWPDCPSHSNECLRYYLGFGTGRSQAQAPHSALHDATVTAMLLAELQRLGTPLEDMLKWTTEPALLPTCPLGDWRGHKWADVEEGFLLWILRKIHDREDVRFCAQAELDRRERERAAARQAETEEEA